MKQIQGVYLKGYVTIKVVGHYPELFFDLCAREGLTVWNIIKKSESECVGNVRLSDVSKIKEIRRRTIYKVRFIDKSGIPFITRRLLIRKPLLIGIALSLFFVFFLSNMVWDVKVKGVHPEIEKRIVEQLNAYGIHSGAMKFTIAPPSKIQKKLLDDIPELLWVGVTERGTTYHLEGVEKTVVEEKEKHGPRHLVASKKGVIVDMFVAKGQPMVNINDYVDKGDLLVSGDLGQAKENEEENEDENEEENYSQELVAAEGEVIAQTWYESNVTIPLETSYEALTGNSKHKYYLGFGEFHIPIWGFKEPEYNQTQIETNDRHFRFLNFKLPISFVDKHIQEKEYVQLERTKEEAVNESIEQAKIELQEKLGQEAKITFEKVLHETIDNGKVKLKLYFTVYENIAKTQPISQGD